jgi:hypothetical protein
MRVRIIQRDKRCRTASHDRRVVVGKLGQDNNVDGTVGKGQSIKGDLTALSDQPRKDRYNKTGQDMKATTGQR